MNEVERNEKTERGKGSDWERELWRVGKTERERAERERRTAGINGQAER